MENWSSDSVVIIYKYKIKGWLNFTIHLYMWHFCLFILPMIQNHFLCFFLCLCLFSLLWCLLSLSSLSSLCLFLCLCSLLSLSPSSSLESLLCLFFSFFLFDDFDLFLCLKIKIKRQNILKLELGLNALYFLVCFLLDFCLCISSDEGLEAAACHEFCNSISSSLSVSELVELTSRTMSWLGFMRRKLRHWYVKWPAIKLYLFKFMSI